MSFSSLTFLTFLGLCVLAYFLLPRRIQWGVLLAASLIFYLWSGVRQVLFLLLTAGVTFCAGRQLERLNQQWQQESRRLEDRALRKQRKTALQRKKRWIVAGALIISMGVLVALKYSGFLVENWNRLLTLMGLAGRQEVPSLLLPLGISFYTFQSTGYVIDIYRGKAEACHSFPRFLLFVCYFPQMVQGPINRYGDLAPALFTPHGFDADQAKVGLQRMLWGFFQKMIIADRLAVIVAQIFDHYDSYGGGLVFLGVLTYSVQLYCDFSGGIDVARGVSQILGISMARNFEQPFFAVTIADFWRRWHISLGEWMKDYLFYPLAFSKGFARLGKRARKILGNEVGKVLPASLATLAVFTAVGIWQGAGWKFILYGLWNGGLMSLSMVCAPLLRRISHALRLPIDRSGWRVVQILRTLLLVTIGRYFSRAATCMTALRMIRHTIRTPSVTDLVDGTIFSLGLAPGDLLLALLGILALLAVGILRKRGVSVSRLLDRQHPVIQWCVLAAGLVVLLLFGVYAEGYVAQEFIYQQI